jgi:hypothetical protein
MVSLHKPKAEKNSGMTALELLLIQQTKNALRIYLSNRALPDDRTQAFGAVLSLIELPNFAGRALSSAAVAALNALEQELYDGIFEPTIILPMEQSMEVSASTRMTKVKVLLEDMLAVTIRDLSRQVNPEFRGKFYGECMGLLKALRETNMLNNAQSDQWSADIYRASLQAAEQCAVTGQPADEAAVSRHRFQLDLLEKCGTTPRADLQR